MAECSKCGGRTVGAKNHSGLVCSTCKRRGNAARPRPNRSRPMSERTRQRQNDAYAALVALGGDATAAEVAKEAGCLTPSSAAAHLSMHQRVRTLRDERPTRYRLRGAARLNSSGRFPRCRRCGIYVERDPNRAGKLRHLIRPDTWHPPDVPGGAVLV